MKFEKEQISQWNNTTYENIIATLKNQKKYNIQKNDYKNEGLYPIMSQEQKFISGFTNDCSKVFNVKNDSYILFGDHTAIFKYLDFDFVIGADGTKIFKSFDENILRTRFLYYISINKLIESTGYNRHFKMLKEKVISYPEDIKEQDKIVSILDQQQGLIDSYKEKLSLLEEQETYYQDELLSGRLRIRLTDESINYATQQGWYLNDDLVEGKEKEFEEWIAVDFHSKVGFYKETDFKDGIYNNKKRKLPFDWNIFKLSDFSTKVKGKKLDSFDKKESGMLPVVNANLLRLGEVNEFALDGVSVEENDITILWDGENAGNVGIGNKGFIASTMSKLTINNLLIKPYYVYRQLSFNNYYLKLWREGSTIPHMSKDFFDLYTIIIPNNKMEQECIGVFFNPFEEQKNLIKEKIKVEEEKMDYLMDELLSGRIRVK